MSTFPHISQFELEFAPRDEADYFGEVAKTLRLQNLASLLLNATDCATDELLALLLGHKTTLKEVVLSSIDITGGLESWKSLLCTIRDELSLDSLIMHECLSDNEDVICGFGDESRAIWLSSFTIAGVKEEWTDIIDRIVVTDTSIEDVE